MEVAEKVLGYVSDLMEKNAEQKEVAARQAEIMNALNGIQQSITSLQLEEEQLEALSQASPAFNEILTWQQQYPLAVQNNDTHEKDVMLHSFDQLAAGYVQAIFSALTGANVGPSAPSILPSWHLASYKKMYTAVNGQYTFTLNDYLKDYNTSISWAIAKAGYAFVCEVLALQDLRDKATTTLEGVNNEVQSRAKIFKTNVNDVLSVAYNQFPTFVKKFKPSYTETGTNLGQWFRMWRTGVHVKNFVGWNNDGNLVGYPYDVGSDEDNEHGCVFQIFPIACDDNEGLYPELEFRFSESNHPLNGLTSLVSRMGGEPVYIYSTGNSQPNGTGLTTTSDPSYWIEGVSFNTASFNVLPVSSADSGTDAPAFVLMPVVSVGGTEEWLWYPGTASPLTFWILRDDGIQQTDWVKTPNSESTVPNEPSRAPGPNPIDNGGNVTPWQWWAD
ncbi:hypothetical protein FLONG3_1122 [Fusarium longipes]|uniref:Uncharacterized protein n=1 Tax=Fusarium longipes TaxID=694270 RepID=A0A395T7Z9_9HYPO|nr:hypothetical protein FLONG3_1122 [Fusarium longipes]